MKVLLSAIACHPSLGSEAKVGWDAARAIARMPGVDECHVMTHGGAKDAIARQQETSYAKTLYFHFFEEPFAYHRSRMVARLQSWLVYRDWQRKSLSRATELHRVHGFGLVHHVTYASWRLPSPLWRMPIPFVFGPVGGGAATPRAFRSLLGGSAGAFELVREAATTLSAASRGLRLCCEKSSAVVAADFATEKFLSSHGATQVNRLCQVFFSDAAASYFGRYRRKTVSEESKLVIFAGGNLEGRKGTQLSLRALAMLQEKGIPFSYTYGGWGPDLKAMEQLARELGIEERVTFHEGYSGQEYIERLATSDVFLLPSIRETAGITMMEAMMAGCYSIVLAGTGAGDIVERAGGAAIRADSPEEAIHKIAQHLEWCYRHTDEMRRHANTASENIRTMYSETNYRAAMSNIYSEAIERHTSRI